MKLTHIFTTAIILVSIGVKAQERTDEMQTLFGSEDKFSVRGFAGFNMKGIELDNQIGVLSGIELDLVINHKMNIGFFGYGLVSEVEYKNAVISDTYYYDMGLGGMKLEPVIASNSLIHLIVPVNFGAGGIGVNKHRYYQEDYYSNQWEDNIYDYDAFVFVEPGLGVELNLFKHFRLNASAGYMFTDKVRIGGTLNKPMDGFTGNVSLRFGWF